MIQRLMAGLLLMFIVTICWAQETLSPGQQINEIKKHPDTYLFAESTTETWESALDNAKFLLCIEVENYVKEQGKQDSVLGYIAKAKNQILELKSMRGERFRAFVYIRKNDLMPYASGEHVMVIPSTQGSSVSTYSPVAKSVETEMVLTEIESQMLTISSGSNIGAFVNRLKSEDKIVSYGRYRDMPNDCNCDIFVYDPNQQIVAILRKSGNQYINLRTKQTDNITNYKGCGAIWLQPK